MAASPEHNFTTKNSSTIKGYNKLNSTRNYSVIGQPAQSKTTRQQSVKAATGIFDEGQYKVEKKKK